jgi:diguanylate cyclase (GGDEF)-like protein
VRIPIAAKFAAMLVILVVSLLVVGFAGLRGLQNLRGHASGLEQDSVTLEQTAALGDDTNRAANLALQIIVSNDALNIARLEGQLSGVVVPRVNADIEALRPLNDQPDEAAGLRQVATLWARFLVVQQANTLDTTAVGATAEPTDEQLVGRVQAIFDPIERLTQQRVGEDARQAATTAARAKASYVNSRTLMIVIALLALLVGIGAVALLTRTIVSRVRRYSDFAARVASGEATGAVAVSGRDELTDLGSTLNDMVEHQIAQHTQEATQAEFAETMQLTESEGEAHHLLKRQLERSIPGSEIVVLNRNNSADRLQATTPIPADSALSVRLSAAKPRSCLAVRFARTHCEELAGDPLLGCEVCGKTAEQVTCEPLLVSGEVIGSVLAAHAVPLTEQQARSIKDSVAQAAPVLANLRNLAIAELRAATDALTGLPNNRAVQDTLKRMVAHAARGETQLGTILLDLDHFKQINDSFGHGRGDDVLAAVGTVLKAHTRASDFVGRYGGEEFIVLLPDTDREGALTSAEKLREAITKITVPGVELPITASLGVAMLPQDAADAATLIRRADRALYTAKNNGRNRVETLPSAEAEARPLALGVPATNGAPAA